ncbi:MAG TPA: PadR family transcriptional regulator [Dongiaceae bacterium]|nr:PadR family transcriptional regulator [Dongiaceae bacterium]
MKPTIPSLGYALLGLIHQKPASGYDLRKIFSSTSMRTYSDSPGAIYPALRRLQKQGLIRGTVEKASGLRQRQMFRLTPEGRAELKKWITQPIASADLHRSLEEIMLRFAFSESVAGPSASIALLKSLHSALTASVAALHAEFEASHKSMPLSARLAFESGVRSTECLLQWTEYALASYQKHARKKGSAS